MIGSIPNKITYISSLQVIESKYHPSGHEVVLDSIVVKHAKHIIEPTSSCVPKIYHDLDNSPITNIRIVGIEKRTKSVWKVVTPYGHMVDIDEDIILESILSDGCENGWLNSQYIFAQVHSNIKLIKVGSPLYETILESNNIHHSKAIKFKNLELGGIYKDKSHAIYVYLGVVSTVKSNREYVLPDKLTYTLSVHNNQMLWLVITDTNLDINKNYIFNSSYFKFKIKKSSSVVRKIGHIDWTLNDLLIMRDKARESLPDDINSADYFRALFDNTIINCIGLDGKPSWDIHKSFSEDIPTEVIKQL